MSKFWKILIGATLILAIVAIGVAASRGSIDYDAIKAYIDQNLTLGGSTGYGEIEFQDLGTATAPSMGAGKCKIALGTSTCAIENTLGYDVNALDVVIGADAAPTHSSGETNYLLNISTSTTEFPPSYSSLTLPTQGKIFSVNLHGNEWPAFSAFSGATTTSNPNTGFVWKDGEYVTFTVHSTSTSDGMASSSSRGFTPYIIVPYVH